MRLFAAVQPPTPVLDHLETALASVRGGSEAGTALRWTPPEGRHVTLAFYGEVGDGYTDELAAALESAGRSIEPFEASLRGAGLFDGRTLWVGCAGDGWTRLIAAATGVGTELLRRAPELRSRPHLTVARMRSHARRGATGAGEREVGAIAHALALYTGPTWTVGEIALVSSRLGAGPSGSPLYGVVQRFELPTVAG